MFMVVFRGVEGAVVRVRVQSKGFREQMHQSVAGKRTGRHGHEKLEEMIVEDAIHDGHEENAQQAHQTEH